MASTHHGVVYTKKWVVDLILDVAGYVPDTGISDKVIIEPSCGCGAFLTVIAGRLADDAIAVGKGWTSLGNAIRAYDIDSASIETARKAAVEALMTRGCPAIQARELCEQWIVHGDFILDDVPAADFIVGNPPYVRAVEIDRTKRSFYVKRLSSVTTGCDLYVSFFDRGLDALKVGGTLCFICADRWLQNKYGTLLRSRMGTDCDLVSLVRMHGVDAFDDEVDAYPAITTIRKGVSADHLKFVNCAPEFNEADATAVLDWLMDDEPDLVGERFEAFEIDKPTGDRMYPLGNHDLVRFVSQACDRLPKLEEAGVKLGIGIATGCDDVFLTEDDDLVESDRMVPIFYMRDHRRGNDDRHRWLVNPWNDDGTLVNLEEYPRLKTYFETNKERLSRRYVAKKNKAAWYRTIDKLTPGLLDRNLLLIPDMAVQPDPILSHGKYPHHNCYWITSDEWDLEVLGGLLMADTTRRFIDALGVKMRGGTLRFQAQYLRLVHMPEYIQISDTNKLGLSRAFNEKDRALATKFAEAAYKEAME
ncbi:Eco57I restriction-modification methylase domain-containing protein [Bifidobacterium bifidum]|jgi:hypothetical protein|uniref:Eco57I restriction-modification methylase domain-containing protein n=1 Tax=Bifidobacterium bifidum TaxID=1681 RepID=UPI004026F36F